MNDYYILNDAGQPVQAKTVIEWAEWFEKADVDRRIALDEITPNVKVSTVFLGLDHRFGMSGDPIIFETMIFGGPIDGHMRRYSTRFEAEEGHKDMVKLAKESQGL